MDCIATRLPYRQTKAFSTTALDYIDQVKEINDFFGQPPTVKGISSAIEARTAFDKKKGLTYRETLVRILKNQYGNVPLGKHVQDNINSLLSPDTFTVTTAHQNNIFSGPLYFIYKIVHAITLAGHLNETVRDKVFVPVFYVGSEDADLDELNHIYLGGQKLTWNTNQTGAVGRMKIDKDLLRLIDAMEGQLAVMPEGETYISIIRKHYREGILVQEATFGFVNELFADYGLLVLIPDHSDLKSQLIPVFREDLFGHKPSEIVSGTAAQLEAAGYKVQAMPREINLFYLGDGIRGRIDREGDLFTVQMPETISGPAIRFTEKEISDELEQHPDRFSPNVILRGLYQETILPDVAFIGGGGELAYWLQLKELFSHYHVPFPVLVLRNSFLIVEKKWQEKINRLGFGIEDLFSHERELVDKLVKRESKTETKLNGSLPALEQLYDSLKKQAGTVDSTLERHVDALKHRTVYKLHELEKKMWRAEKRKFTDQQRQIAALRNQLFPGGGLQERHDNLGYYYAKWGRGFIDMLIKHSPALEQEFVVLREA